MTRRNKWISLFLTTALCVSMLVGCGDVQGDKNSETNQGTETETGGTDETQDEEPKDPVEIVYWYDNGVGVQQYTQQVEDKINEMMQELPGYEHITLRLHPSGNYATDLTLGQSNGDQMDVISAAGLDDDAEIANGTFMVLDDLLAANPEVVESLPDWFIEFGQVNGIQYTIPNYQQMANQYYWYTDQDVMDYYCESRETTYEEIGKLLRAKDFDQVRDFYEDYINACREYLQSDEVYLSYDEISNLRFWIQPSNSIVGIDWYALFYWDEETQKINFSDLNENIQKGYLQNGEWYQSNLIYQNWKTDSAFCADGDWLTGKQSCGFMRMQGYGTEEMVAATLNASSKTGDMVVFNLNDYIFISNKNAASGVGISSTCEHPEEAAKVLALLFNEKYSDIYNTLCWGLEDIHYEKISDNEIKTLEFDGTQGGVDTTYCYHKWRGGNTFNASRNQAMSQEQEDYILNEINDISKNVLSPLVGLRIDTSGVETEIAQLRAVVGEYQEALRYGLKGAETQEYLNLYLEKLENAGLSKVLEEFNRQADEFLGR